MKKPLIGRTPSYDSESGDIKARPAYLKALKAAGAIPVLLPLEAAEKDFKQLVQALDGFLFTGGPDVHPFFFGEETLEGCGNVSGLRDEMERTLLPLVLELRKPILGICRGIQLLNIALGGTIWQDISSQVKRDSPLYHSQPYDFHLPCHRIFVEKDSLLAQITRREILEVNSMHHQAVRDLAPGLAPSAYSPDHLAEALEMPGYPFFLGVQWHPEYLWEKEDGAFRLFQAFVRACEGE